MRCQLRKLVREMLIYHEGFSSTVYKDSEGHSTIAYGRNVDSLGVSKKEGIYLLDNDMFWVEKEISNRFPWFSELNDSRKAVMMNMVYNLGMPRFQYFIFTLRAIEQRDWQAAAREMLDSRWADQVGQRAKDLSYMMRTGTQFPGLT